MSTYFAILTQVGEAKLANAIALGQTVNWAAMSVGDGNGITPVPDRLQTALVNEWRTAPLNQLIVDPSNPSQIIAEQVMPEDVGGKWIRELGIRDEDGDLCAVANCPPSYKPLLAEGSGRTQVVRVVLIVASTTAINLKIDPSVVLATRKYADDLMSAHIQATNPHEQYALIDSPDFIGTPTAPTPDAGNSSTKLATTAFIQTAFNGITSVSIAGAVTTNLTAKQAGTGILMLTGAVTATKAVTLPATSGKWTVKHSGTGNFVVTLKTLGGTGILLWPGDCVDVWSEGVNIYLCDPRPRMYALTNLPAADFGPIYVIGTQETWEWVSTAYFTGYRSIFCGEPVFSASSSPLPIHLDMIGGEVPKVGPYAGLWGIAQERNQVVPLASWTPGVHAFADVGNGNFRLPDGRDMFWRATGTDRDTANARAIGSKQDDATQRIQGTMQSRSAASAFGGIFGGSGPFQATAKNNQTGTSTIQLGADGTNGDTITFDTKLVVRTSVETRSTNTAYATKVHI